MGKICSLFLAPVSTLSATFLSAVIYIWCHGSALGPCAYVEREEGRATAKPQLR